MNSTDVSQNGQIPAPIPNNQVPLAKSTSHTKTHKKPVNEVIEQAPVPLVVAPMQSIPGSDHLRNLLDESARDAFTRPWHRLERGLRLNRLRMYVEQISPQCSFTNDEKAKFFAYLQNALDRKLLNTHKIVNYVPEQQRIVSITGLEVRRAPDGTAKWGFVTKKPKDTATRKKRKVDEAGNEVETA